MDKENNNTKQGAKAIDSNALLDAAREALANYAHATWRGWMNYLFSKSNLNDDGSVTIPKWAVDRWQRQIRTRYWGLPEEEKETDRKEADKMISVIKEISDNLNATLDEVNMGTGLDPNYTWSPTVLGSPNDIFVRLAMKPDGEREPRWEYVTAKWCLKTLSWIDESGVVVPSYPKTHYAPI